MTQADRQCITLLYVDQQGKPLDAYFNPAFAPAVGDFVVLRARPDDRYVVSYRMWAPDPTGCTNGHLVITLKKLPA